MLPLVCLAALAADPGTVDGVPLPVAQEIWQIELLRLPAKSLASLAADPSPAVRARVALAIGRLRDEKDGPALLATLARDPEVEVRRAAAFALGQTRGTERTLVDRWKQESDPSVRARLAVALGKQGGADAVEHLLDGLDGPAAAASAEGLGRLAMRRVEGAVSERVARRLLDQVTPLPLGPTRQRAAWALARMGLTTASPATVSRLGELAARDPDGRVRAWLLRAWAEVATGEARDTGLVHAASDAFPAVRIAAARAFARGCGPAAGPALARLLVDPDPPVRLEAIAAVGACAALDAPAMLRDALRSEEPTVRAAAVRALAANERLQGGPEAWLGAEQPMLVRIAAVESLTDPRRLQELATRSPEPPIRSAAAGALLGLEKLKPADVLPLVGARDPVIAQAAADWLREHPDLESEGPLVARLKQGDLAATEAVTFVKALAAVYRSGRIATPTPDAAAAVAPWLGHPQLRADVPAITAVLRIPTPPVDHPTRRIPPLAEVLAIRSARIYTSEGEIRVDLAAADAPYTVWNFATLADRGYFDGIVFHRVVPDFVAQAGDPRGDGWGGPGWEIPDEINERAYEEGAVGMALAGPDTGGSQWFITLSPQPHLDGSYTVFGKVTQGLQNARAIDQGDRIERIVIERGPPPSSPTSR